MCMIATAVQYGEEASPGKYSGELEQTGAPENPQENNADDRERGDNNVNTDEPLSLSRGVARNEGIAEPGSSNRHNVLSDGGLDSSGEMGTNRGTVAAAPDATPWEAKSKQRIKVVVRIRPLNDPVARTTSVLPDGKTLCLVSTPDKDAKEQLNQGRLRKKKKELIIPCDRVLGENASQKEVYEQVRDCVRFPFLGVNACVFAYGQTGSGKTYTMTGTGSSRCGQAVDLSSGTNSLPSEKEARKRDAAEEQQRSRGCRPEEDISGVLGDGAGIIHRAVDDMFAYVRQRLDGEQISADGAHSPSYRSRSAPQATADKRPNTAGGFSACTSSSGSRYSDDFSIDEPSAACWPLNDQSGCMDGEITEGCRRRRTPRFSEGAGDETHRRDKQGSPRARANCTVEMSSIQVYNGLVYDLLSVEPNQRPLPILDTATPATSQTEESQGGGVEEGETAGERGEKEAGWSLVLRRSSIAGLSVHSVETAEQVMGLLRQGRRNRCVRSTEMNSNSSRSHSIVQFTISSTRSTATRLGEPRDEGPPIEESVTTRAKLSLVDLAGSEKGGSRSLGEDGQERERSRINSSLSALSNCICRLGEAGRRHVPFRDSPLTRLLQDSLVGGKTMVIATISPSVDAQDESISTLNFAVRCMRVVVRQRVNEIASDALLLQRARRQICVLRRRLKEVENTACPNAPIASEPDEVQPPSGPSTSLHGATHSAAESIMRKPSVEEGLDSHRDSGAEGAASIRQEETRETPGETTSGRPLVEDTVHKAGSSSLSGERNPRGRLAPAAESKRRRSNPEAEKNDENTRSRVRDKALDARRGRDTVVRKPSVPVNLNRRRKSEGMDAKHGVRAESRVQMPSRVVAHQSRNVPNGDDLSAEAALIERFSCREGELLRELETLKARCEELSGKKSTSNVASEQMHSPRSENTLLSSPLALRHAQPSVPGTNAGRTTGVSHSSVARVGVDVETSETSTQGLTHQGPVKPVLYDEHEMDGVPDRENNQPRLRVTALYDFTPEQDGDLQLRAGEILEVLRQRRDGWWYGRCQDDATGLFPSNYVEHVNDHIVVSTWTSGGKIRKREGSVDLAVAGVRRNAFGKAQAAGRHSPTQHSSGGAGGNGLALRSGVESTRRIHGNKADASSNHTMRRVGNDNAGGDGSEGLTGATLEGVQSRLPTSALSASLDDILVASERSYGAGRGSTYTRGDRALQQATTGLAPEVNGTEIQAATIPLLNYSRRHTQENDGKRDPQWRRHLQETLEGARGPTAEFSHTSFQLLSPVSTEKYAPTSAGRTDNNFVGTGSDVCQQHRLSACILCRDRGQVLPDGLVVSSPGLMTGVQKAAVWRPDFGTRVESSQIVSEVVSDNGLQRNDAVEQTSAPLRATVCNAVTCERHLLPDCVLCKIRLGSLGRSTSLPALGTGSGTDDRIGTEKSALTGPKLTTVGVADALGGGGCKRHSLPGCFLCGDRASIAGRAARSLHASDAIACATENRPMEPSPIYARATRVDTGTVAPSGALTKHSLNGEAAVVPEKRAPAASSFPMGNDEIRKKEEAPEAFKSTYSLPRTAPLANPGADVGVHLTTETSFYPHQTTGGGDRYDRVRKRGGEGNWHSAAPPPPQLSRPPAPRRRGNPPRKGGSNESTDRSRHSSYYAENTSRPYAPTVTGGRNTGARCELRDRS